MQTTFTNQGTDMIEIWDATVDGYRINVTASHGNLHPFTFMLTLDSEIVGKGFGQDVTATMRKAISKAVELGKARAEVESMLAEIESGTGSVTGWWSVAMDSQPWLSN